MHPKTKSRRADPRSGIALVVVLGFLTVLVLMAVSFAIIMRTERMASRAFADVVRAKQITQAGLARAMQRIETEVGNDIYPETNAWVSGGTVTTNPLYGLATTLGARRYLPLATWGTNQIATANYENILDPNNNNRVIGRYAYMIIDCSGLLDANYIGGEARTSGASAAEIQLNTNILTELTAYGTNALPTWRASTWKRFESLPDLLAVAQSNAVMPSYVISPNNYRTSQFLENTSNLFIYSRAPVGWLDGSVVHTDPVYIGITNFDIGAAQTAFAAADMAGGEALAVTECLSDYIDGDSRPKSVNSYTVEPTPLINEVLFEQQMQTPTLQVIRTQVELWYPFVGVNNTNNYTLNFTVIFTNCLPAAYNPRNGGPIGGGRYGVSVNISGPWTASRWVHLTTPGNMPVASGIDTNLPVDFSDMKAIVVGEVREGGSSGPLVDRVSFDVSLSFASKVPAASMIGGKAVTDPRLNYITNQWIRVGQGVAQNPTPGVFNSTVTDPALPPGDGLQATNMYVANRVPRSVGELGLLKSGPTPWTTIKLLGPDAWPVLDRFTLSTNRVNLGRVNMNSLQLPVLASAIYGADSGPWPNSTGSTNIDVAGALTIANLILAGGPYTNVSDIKNSAPSGSYPGYTAIDSEGLVRSSMDLMTTRQQIYTIIVQGEYIDAYTNSVAIGKCAAVVWRDPFPGNSSTHTTVTRFFKWLDVLE